MKFPKKIYVTVENEGKEDQFLEVNKSIEHFNAPNQKVAIYDLKEVKTLKVTIELE